MTIIISHWYPHLLTWPLMPIDIHYVCGLCTSICSNHWQTPCVWAPYPIHVHSWSPDLFCASGPLSIQPVDRLCIQVSYPVCDLLDIQVLLCLHVTSSVNLEGCLS